MSELSDDGAVPVEAPAPRVDTPGAGELLRAERQRQGLSIGDVAQRLKYAPRQIEAVEAGDFAALPGLTFVRGFVRGYAKLLGIDAAPLVASLERSAGHEGGPTTVQLQSVSPTRAQFPATTTRYSAAWPWMLAILVAVACVGGYSVYHWQAPTGFSAVAPAVVPVAPPGNGAPLPPGAVAGSIGTDAPRPGEPVPSITGAETPQPGIMPPPDAVADKPAAEAAGTPAAQGRIRMVFRGESWTEIRDAGGRVVYSRKSAAGSEQWADGQPPFDLVVGNAPETRLYYRGNEVDLAPYIKGSVARLQLQ